MFFAVLKHRTALAAHNLRASLSVRDSTVWSSSTLSINRIQVGNIVTITNLWEELRYEVVGIQIIAPNDLDAIKIQPGKEMITLLSCHPVASGGKQRYLVFCERIT